jgi:pyrimidine operon attenuation protein/uracil phosphoribosyltransferase
LIHQLPAVDETIEKMIEQLRPILPEDPLLVGIHSGGVWIAERLHELLKISSDLGTIDITFYRDDFSTIGLHPQVNTSFLPEDIEGRNILLVDDVLQTGRTIRAALNEIFSYGRPATVLLAVLVDRGQRELPIQADICGLNLQLDEHQQIKLNGPECLELRIMKRENTG